MTVILILLVLVAVVSPWARGLLRGVMGLVFGLILLTAGCAIV